MVDPQILILAANEYPLPWDGIHVLDHWARVLENGERLAQVTGADMQVVSLFAVLHDCRRENEGCDHRHGPRAAALIDELGPAQLKLDEDQFARLSYAIAMHTEGLTQADITVQTCWDSDRLDLMRCWIEPHPRKLCTAAARDPEILAWAIGRGHSRVVPDLVDQWLKILSGQ